MNSNEDIDIQFDGEDEEETESLNIPIDRRSVKTEKLDLPIDTVFGWVNRGKINPQPDFQRYYVWKPSKASKLIESLLLDIPIPVIYMAEEKDKSLSVVDGQQRIVSICSYINGKFPDGRDFKLTGLQVLEELNGKQFKELTTDQQEAIQSATIRVIKISSESDADVKFEIFERLNVGAEKLNDQELRNSVYRGTYNELLKKLSKNPTLLKILKQTECHPRMVDRQLILRFFTMWRNTHLKYKSPMKQFLNKEMDKYRNASASEIQGMEAIFIKSIEISYYVFGINAFRRFNYGDQKNLNGHWESKLNVALWDTLLYTFSFFEKNQIIPISDSIKEEFIDIVTNDQNFAEYISSSTDKPDRITYRAEKWKQRVENLVSFHGPRNFSYSLKERLFRQDQTCQICDQHIFDIDDSEVDHITHYWRGGQTIPENARLTHRFCNRSRGGRD